MPPKRKSKKSKKPLTVKRCRSRGKKLRECALLEGMSRKVCSKRGKRLRQCALVDQIDEDTGRSVSKRGPLAVEQVQVQNYLKAVEKAEKAEKAKKAKKALRARVLQRVAARRAAATAALAAGTPLKARLRNAKKRQRPAFLRDYIMK